MSALKRRRKAVLNRINVAHLACKWDLIKGRERGCHVQRDFGRYLFACKYHDGAA